MNARYFLAIFVLTLSVITGCGPDLNMGSVTGTVRYKGEPVAGALVSFLPASGEGVLASGKTDDTGVYVLAAPVVVKGKGVTEGAVAGTYNVSVRKTEYIPSKSAQLYAEGKITYDDLQRSRDKGVSRDLIPRKYKSPKTSGLTAEVKAKTENVIDFDLE